MTSPRSPLPSTEAFRAGLQASLGPWHASAPRVLAALRRFGVGEGALEASARWTPGQPATGLRMMLEGLRPDAAQAVLACLPVPQAPLRALLAEAAEAPVIVGWDCGRPEPVAKVYLNLSDRSAAERTALARRLGLPAAPHVLGRNVAGGRTETKVYVQQAALAPEAPAALRTLAQQAGCAGAVLSHDLMPDGTLQLRALFVAPQRADRAVLAALPGWREAGFDRAIPYPWSQVRSVGVAADGGAWVAYVKRRGAGAAMWQLEPAVCVRTTQGELGVHLEPAGAQRAYAYTERHALSYRLRAGTVDPAAVAEIMRWAYAAIRAWEAGGQAGPVVWGQAPKGCDVVPF